MPKIIVILYLLTNYLSKVKNFDVEKARIALCKDLQVDGVWQDVFESSKSYVKFIICI